MTAGPRTPIRWTTRARRLGWTLGLAIWPTCITIAILTH